jgi:integrase/recombinase XerC
MPRKPKPWYKASHKAWYVKIEGKPRRLGATEKEANREFHKLMASRPDDGPSPGMITVIELLDYWLSDRAKSVRPITLDFYARVCQRFADWVGKGRKAVDLRVKDVSAYLDSKEWSRGTRAASIKVIKSAFAWGEASGWIEKNPLRGLRAPSIPSRAGVDPLEVDRFLDELPPGAREIVAFMLATGCRPGEARTLAVEDVDIRRGTAEVRGKAGRRTVVLPSAALESLRAIISRRPTGAVFRNSYGDPWSPRSLTRAVKKARDFAGFSPDLVPYSCRGAFATRAIERGVDSSLVAKLLGHSSPMMLYKHYHKPTDPTLRRAADQSQSPRKKKPKKPRNSP